MERIKVGVIGCGMISEIYMKNITTLFADSLTLVACANRSPAAAEQRAAEFGIKAMTVEELLESPDVELVLNLTVPASHFEINKQILLAGKHCYCEKPLAMTLEEGRWLLTLAKERGLLVASAPDTFLGAGLQTCFQLLQEGVIGKPVSAQAFMIGTGPEVFHANPAFFYQPGAGPLFDMGPYYYTALAAAFGPAMRVVGFGSRSVKERQIQNPASKLYPGTFPVEVDTLVSGMVEFQNGVIANIITSWDFDYPYFKAPFPALTVLGTKGTMFMPDPNTFGGTDSVVETDKIGRTITLVRSGKREEVPLRSAYVDNCRGLGLADLARCIRQGGKPRVSGEMALHVLEMMLGVAKSAETGAFNEMTTTFTKPLIL